VNSLKRSDAKVSGGFELKPMCMGDTEHALRYTPTFSVEKPPLRGATSS
jgi:hypothetical protein